MRRLLICLAAASLLAGCAAAPSFLKGGSGQPAADVLALSADDMQGRRIGTPGGAKARAYIVGRFRAMGLAPGAAGGGYEQPFKAGTVGGVNLIGRIEGSDPGGRVLVITAHYDHLGVANGQIYNGADDNASGVAALLAAAEAFRRKPPKHTVLFVALDGEEVGLTGAQAFVADPPVPLARMALNVNFDMLATNLKNELYVSGGWSQPWLRPRLDALAKRAKVSLKQGHDTPDDKGQDNWTDGSDHFAFKEKGVPWVYFGVEDHPEYHQPTDDFATIPLDFFRRSVATVVMACRQFDEDLDVIAKESGR